MFVENVAEGTVPAGQDHWASKDGIKLFLWNKKRVPSTPYQGTILFIHGSSWCSQPTFDLEVPGRPWSSVMNFFAAKGDSCLYRVPITIRSSLERTGKLTAPGI